MLMNKLAVLLALFMICKVVAAYESLPGKHTGCCAVPDAPLPRSSAIKHLNVREDGNLELQEEEEEKNPGKIGRVLG